MSWNHSCRLRHVTSGRYLAATADNQVVTFHRNAATEEATAFFVRENKVRTALNRYTLARGEPVSGFQLPYLQGGSKKVSCYTVSTAYFFEPPCISGVTATPSDINVNAIEKANPENMGLAAGILFLCASENKYPLPSDFPPFLAVLQFSS